MNEPKLRFPEFTGDWAQHILSDIIVDIADGPFGSNLKLEHYTDKKEARIIQLSNISDYGWQEENTRYTTFEHAEEIKRCIVNEDELIMGKMMPAGMTIMRPTTDKMYVLSSDCVRIKLDKSAATDEFFLYTTKSEEFLNQIRSSSQGSTRIRISISKIKNMNLNIPSLPEQQKIGFLFTKLDTLIQSAQKELEGYRELKQGMLQKMFPKKGEKAPEIRFPEFTGDWEQRKLKEILIQRTEHQKISDDAPLLAFSYAEGVISPEDKKSNKRDFIMTDKYNKIFSRTELNDIIYNPANVIHGAIHRNKLGTGVVSPIYKIFMCNGVSPKFIGERLHTDKFILEATKFIEGTVVKLRTLSPEMFLEMSIEIPKSYEEQDKIGTYFTNLDNLITLQQKELDGYKELKKGLLQQMFC